MMLRLLRLLLFFETVITLCRAQGPWTPGWGFHASGVPPLPSKMQSYALNRSIVGYFIANNTGLASPAELAAEVKLGIVGIGWNLNHVATSAGEGGGGLEHYEVQQAAALKQARSDVGVVVLRNTEVISTFWDSGRVAMKDADLWLQSPPGSGKPIAEQWSTDDPKSGGATVKYFLNFSNPRTQQWWLDEYVGPVLDQPNIDGIYTDCSCGTARGEVFTQSEAVGRQKAFDAAMALAKAKGKFFTSWVNVGPARLSKGNCAAAMTDAISVGANASRTLQWLTNSVAVSKEEIAAFLIARGSSAIIALPAYDAPMLARPFQLEDVDLNADPGVPSGVAEVNGQIYKRSYTNAEVSLDCGSFTSTISFKTNSVLV